MLRGTVCYKFRVSAVYPIPLTTAPFSHIQNFLHSAQFFLLTFRDVFDTLSCREECTLRGTDIDFVLAVHLTPLPQLLAIHIIRPRHAALTPHIKSQRSCCGLRGTNTVKGRCRALLS